MQKEFMNNGIYKTAHYLISTDASSAFDVTRWDHWLLIVCFMIIAACGLWISWQWQHHPDKSKRSSNKKEAKAAEKLAHRLMIELHGPSAKKELSKHSKPFLPDSARNSKR
ncbi:MAG: hypothetical protein AAF703_22805 [Cyanobacteria bacterium P01_D01_bin.105]